MTYILLLITTLIFLIVAMTSTKLYIDKYKDSMGIPDLNENNNWEKAIQWAFYNAKLELFYSRVSMTFILVILCILLPLKIISDIINLFI